MPEENFWRRPGPTQGCRAIEEEKQGNCKWYWARTRDKASHDPMPIPLGYRGHQLTGDVKITSLQGHFPDETSMFGHHRSLLYASTNDRWFTCNKNESKEKNDESVNRGSGAEWALCQRRRYRRINDTGPPSYRGLNI
ncbi:hypothetical protein TNCV_1687861 [Trichonephila clavipes]|nr:hypothetical protein TNCV_1687861 [Trichonephila clavipes]